MSKKLCFLISFVLVLSLAGSAQSRDVYPRAISVNFGADGWAETLLEPGDVAGAPGFEMSNWNNVYGISGTLAAGSVIDADGIVVPGSEVTWNAAAEWTAWPATSGTASDYLMYWAIIANPSVSPSTITVTNIPYDEYHVVVYQVDNEVGWGAMVSVVGHPDTYCSQPDLKTDPANTSFWGEWVQVTSTDPANPTVWGNYSVHAGLTGATCTINWTGRPLEDGWGWVAGFQIVKTHLFNPIPADGSTVPTSVNQLQWTLPEPNEPEGVVTCDVYFETHPPIPGTDVPIVANLAVESVAIGPLTADTNYYWGIGVYDDSISITVPYMWSHVLTFRAVSNFPPIVDANDDVETWLANGATERDVQLGGVLVEDDGVPGPATFEWTVTAEPNELNPATFDDATLLNATVTVKEVGSYTLQLEADDGDSTGTDTMQIELYADSCEHARNQAGFVWLVGDLNRDCKIDFLDFANFAADWLEENYSTE